MHVHVDAYAIGCGVLATIEKWYPARKFNGTMVPHKRNSKVWPGLVTKEKTMKYPTSAMCTVYVYRPDTSYMYLKGQGDLFLGGKGTSMRNL